MNVKSLIQYEWASKAKMQAYIYFTEAVILMKFA